MSCDGSGSNSSQAPTDAAPAPKTPISGPICNAGADGLCSPAAIAVDASGNLYVADQSNNRVLEYDNPLDPSGGTPGTPGSPGDTTADEVFGQQGDFTGTGCADGQTPDAALNATGLCGPSGVAVDSAGSLFISDSGNNRVLGFSGPATSASRAARAGREPNGARLISRSSSRLSPPPLRSPRRRPHQRQRPSQYSDFSWSRENRTASSRKRVSSQAGPRPRLSKRSNKDRTDRNKDRPDTS